MKHEDPKSLTITLPADQMQRLDEAVASGEYASRDEIVVDALRAWEESETAWLRKEHQDGLASGLAEDLTPQERLSRIKAEFMRRG